MAPGSDVSISDSRIRSIGLWFEGHDSIQVSGLVDNSEYVSYTANLPDRHLQFENSSVQTWSLYPMDSVNRRITVGKHDDVLADWDTHGLSPGAYVVKLVLCDNTADSNKVEALKNMNLLPKILGIQENEQNPITKCGGV